MFGDNLARKNQDPTGRQSLRRAMKRAMPPAFLVVGDDECPDDLSYWSTRDEWEASGRQAQTFVRSYLRERRPIPAKSPALTRMSAAGNVMERLAR
jgi:hypothetical protein